MIAGGTGITPFMQILVDAAAEVDGPELSLIFCNKTEQDILLKDQLDSLSEQGLNLHYVVESPSENWNGHTGLLNEDLIEDLIPNPSDGHLVMHCGQPGMNEFVRELLLDLGHSENNVFQY